MPRQTAPRIALMVFAGLLKWIFWLPLMTIHLADGRIIESERRRFGFAAFAGWTLAALILLLNAKGEYPWANVWMVNGFIHYWLGSATLLVLNHERALASSG